MDNVITNVMEQKITSPSAKLSDGQKSESSPSPNENILLPASSSNIEPSQNAISDEKIALLLELARKEGEKEKRSARKKRNPVSSRKANLPGLENRVRKSPRKGKSKASAQKLTIDSFSMRPPTKIGEGVKWWRNLYPTLGKTKRKKGGTNRRQQKGTFPNIPETAQPPESTQKEFYDHQLKTGATMKILAETMQSAAKMGTNSEDPAAITNILDLLMDTLFASIGPFLSMVALIPEIKTQSEESTFDRLMGASMSHTPMFSTTEDTR